MAYDNHHVNIMRWDPKLALTDLPLHKLELWVRIEGLNPENLTRENTITIGEGIGQLTQVDDPDTPDAAVLGYLRVKVKIDTKKPLPSGFSFPIPSDPLHRVIFAMKNWAFSVTIVVIWAIKFANVIWI